MTQFSPEHGPAGTPVEGLISIYTTIDSDAQAMHLATDMVNSGLVACGNVFPSVKSIYVFDGQLNLDDECVVIFKTAADKAEAAMKRLHEMHPYEVPCITAHAVSSFGDYADWVQGNTRNKHF